MSESILTTVKEALGIQPSYTAFDSELITHINSVLATLNELGVGPPEGFAITGASQIWSDILNSELRLNDVKSYVFLKVKLLFDPPTIGYVLDAYKNMILEAEWRLTVKSDGFVTDVTVAEKSIIGVAGDMETVTVKNPTGQNYIHAGGEYEADFTPKDKEYSTPVDLITSSVASGILYLPITISNGSYRVRSVDPRRTLLTLSVKAK